MGPESSLALSAYSADRFARAEQSAVKLVRLTIRNGDVAAERVGDEASFVGFVM